MIDKIKKYIKENNLIKDGENIVIGFSGGPDSVMLLYALNELRKEYGYNLVTVHINHQLRGDEAVKDEEFSKDFANSLGVKCISFHMDVEGYAKEHKISVEDAGRRIRYEKFNEVLMKEFGSGVIAVGHHKNDDAETILLNLIRGAGGAGLSGISDKNKNVVRPLIHVTKGEIINFLKENKIPFVEDKTNFENDYIRNKIRNVLIPYVEEEINENFIDSLVRSSKILESNEEFLENYADGLNLICHERDYYKLNCKDFEKHHIAIQRKLILMAYEVIKGDRKDISFNNVESIRKIILSGSGEFYINDFMFYMAYGYLYLTHAEENKDLLDFTIKEKGKYDFGDFLIDVDIVENKGIKLKKNEFIFPIGLIEEGIVVRTRRDGDRIRLKNFTKKVKDIFIDSKVPKHLRDKIPILQYKNDIILITGLKRTHKYLVNSSDDYVIKIRLEENHVE